MLYFLKIVACMADFLKIGKRFMELSMKIMPGLSKVLLKTHSIIFICGSCGKTTTMHQTAATIKDSGYSVFCEKKRESAEEILLSLLKRYNGLNSKKTAFAIFEVDALLLKKITETIEPEILAVTNIFQEKNHGEDIYSYIEEGAENLKDTMFVLNGDEPRLYSFAQGHRRYFYGFRINPGFPGGNEADEGGKICHDCGEEYKYIYNTYAHLGNYSCEKCFKTRPQLALGVDNVYSLDENGSSVSFDGLQINIPLAGGSNIYNALCAATLAGAAGIGPENIKNGIENTKNILSVQETVRVDTKELRLILVDSALDCTESVNAILPDNGILYIACLLSESDVSWIESVPFEKLATLNYHGVLIGGSRYKEVSERLETAGLDTAKFMICEDFESFLYSVRTNVIGRTYIFASKKAMKSLRRNLHKKGYLKKL